MISNSVAVQRFADGKDEGGSANLWARDGVLYSYGSHFPLAFRGPWGDGVEYLINGDKYSVSTSRHQNEAICSLPANVQIPFSALQQVPELWSGIEGGYSARFNHRPTLIVMAQTPDESWGECSICGTRTSYNGYCPNTEHEAAKTLWRHILGSVLIRDSKGGYWLSSIDANETGRNVHYFLCELPGPVGTVDEAYESLKPGLVKLFEGSAGPEALTIKRQGDLFLIPTFEAKPRGPTYKGQPVWSEYVDALDDAPIQRFLTMAREGGGYRTDSRHVASQLRAEGRHTYVRGTVRHPEHKRVSLGKEWHLVVKNLAGRAFNAVGSVD